MRPALLLLASLLGGCGWALGGVEPGEVNEPEFRPLRIAGEEPAPDPKREGILLYLQRDGRVDRGFGHPIDEPPGPGQLVSKPSRRFDDPLKQLLFNVAESHRDFRHPDDRTDYGVHLVPEARAPWRTVRAVLAVATDPDVRLMHGRLIGVQEGSRVAWRTPFALPRRNPDDDGFVTWDWKSPRRTVVLTDAARGGIDPEALARRVGEGPVLLSAADEVPAQVVADALVALNLAGAGPVLLSPDPPKDVGEETLPGVVIR